MWFLSLYFAFILNLKKKKTLYYIAQYKGDVGEILYTFLNNYLSPLESLIFFSFFT